MLAYPLRGSADCWLKLAARSNRRVSHLSSRRVEVPDTDESRAGARSGYAPNWTPQIRQDVSRATDIDLSGAVTTRLPGA